MLLDVKEIICGYENTIIVDGCNFSVNKGDIACIVGPNGAGKSTAMKAIFGLIPIKSGKVIFNDENITGIPSYELFAKGVLRTFQISHEFSNLTVLENLMMVPPNQSGENLINALFMRKKFKNEGF